MTTKFQMRNVVKTVAILAVSTMIFASCEPAEDDPTPDPGTEQDANFVAFTFEGIDGAAEIDRDERTVSAQAKETVDLADITAEFTLSTGATATVDGTPQVSGTTANDFNDPVIYTVTSGDGETTLDWTVTIIKPLPVGKKYITYNKPVTAYYIEYNGGAVEANQDPGRWGTAHPVIEAYENKKYAWVSFIESRFECNITYPDGSWCFNWECAYGGNVWMLDKLNGNENWESDAYLDYEYPLDIFAFWVSKRNLGGDFMWRNPGGLGDLGDIARYPTQATMPNNTDVTEYYLRNEKVMDIMCDVYKISRSTFWVDPETGFTLKLEARDEQGNLDEDVNYEVTRLVVGTPDWDGEHLHPLPTDTEEESIKFPENKSNIGSSTYSS